MIFGLGSDIVNIDRIAKLLEMDKSGKGFIDKRFTPKEIKSVERYTADNKKQYYAHFAKRYAAKEAFAKAVGTGFGKHLSFKDVGVENDEAGKPFIVLSEKAIKLVNRLVNGMGKAIYHVSLSDDDPYAHAVVIIEVIQ